MATPDRRYIMPWLMQMVLAARAGGLDILDGVSNDFRDLDAFARECEQGAAMGFDGKTLIHPAQIEPALTAFSPSAEAVAEAEAIRPPSPCRRMRTRASFRSMARWSSACISSRPSGFWRGRGRGSYEGQEIMMSFIAFLSAAGQFELLPQDHGGAEQGLASLRFADLQLRCRDEDHALRPGSG